MDNNIKRKTEAKWLKTANNWYVKKPGVRALMQLLGTCTLGIVSAADAALVTKIQNMREERLREFFEELDKGNIALNDDIIQSEDFLHAFFVTTKSVLNTRRKEKIRMFARMLNSLEKDDLKIEEYEDHLNILDDLTCREIIVLATLERYEESGHSGNQLSASMHAHSFWNDFIQEIENNLRLSREEVECILIRLIRTGCYKVFDSTYRDALESCGMLTPVYYKLKEMVVHIECKEDEE